MKKFQVLSGSALKTIALICMLADHTASALLRSSRYSMVLMGTHTVTLYACLRGIGRIAFPIYSFLLVEGYLHTGSSKKYLQNIFLFSLISEVPWDLCRQNTWFYPDSQNVFFTLLLGLLGIWAIDKAADRKQQIVCLFVLLIVSFCLKSDYGVSGFAFILVLYLLRDCRLCQSISGAAMLDYRAGLAAIPILLYNGRRGFLKGNFKYLFYAAYPLHMILLWILRIRFGLV